ncbi:MAG TPA: SBBP repeat-containing protein [Planctomycetota bacterium]|nr:SBBP repeat-containing protein [Planctomycetota bacterium]
MRAIGIVRGLAVLGASIVLAGLLHADSRAASQPDAAARAKAIQLFSAAPAAFIENTGQIDDPSIRYVFNGSGANVYHTTSGPVFQVFAPADCGSDGHSGHSGRSGLSASPESGTGVPPVAEWNHRRDACATFSASFPGARQIKPVGRHLLETKINYCLGADHSRWQMGVPTFGVVVYEGLYDGIDLHTYGRRSNLKYEFHVAPGADWRQIRIRYSGIAGLSLAKDGSLIVNVGDGWGSLTDDAPIIYQEIAGKRIELPGRFVLVDKLTYAFEIDGEVDEGVELVIDPELAWQVFLGGSGYDAGYGIATDAAGNALVTGDTQAGGFPTPDGFDTSYNGGSYDAFVAKVSGSGQLLWATFLGGSGDDGGRGIIVDADGSVLVIGSTDSEDFPGRFGNGGDRDAFVARLDGTGHVVWASFIGGSTSDSGWDIALDTNGNALITGITDSEDLPTPNGFQTILGGNYDSFVAKVSGSGELLWASFLGGSGTEYGYGISTDLEDSAFVTGLTCSPDFPTSHGFDSVLSGQSDAYVAKVSNTGQLLWASFLGGSFQDDGYGIAVGPAGDALVTGRARSSDFPTPNLFGPHAGSGGAFVAKVSGSGQLLWASFLGGSGEDSAVGVAIDAEGNAVCCGYTTSPDFPIPEGFSSSYNGAGDAFVASVSGSGQLLWSCFVGSASYERGTGIAVDADGVALITGYGASPEPPNYYRAFVAKVGVKLAVDSTPSGVVVSGSRPGTAPYTATCSFGEEVSLSAPDPAIVAGVRYNFLRWTLDGQPAPAGTTLTVTMDTDHTAVAQYEIQTYPLTIQSIPSGITIIGTHPGTTPYTAACPDEESVSLSAPAVASVSGLEYSFLRWTLDGTDRTFGEKNLQLTMDAPHSVIAEYRLAGDANGDCRVNVLDLLTIRNRLLLNPQDPANLDAIRAADVNGNNDVSVLDLIYSRNRLGRNCP